jgi:hypothetical protein
MIVSIDCGNSMTKGYYEQGDEKHQIIFPSTIVEGRDDFNESAEFKFDDEYYVIGLPKNSILGDTLDKTGDDRIRLIIATLFKMGITKKVSVLGLMLPASVYKEKRKELVKKLKNQSFKISGMEDGREKHVNIQIGDVVVRPEGVTPALSLREHDNFLMYDIGGGTVDVSVIYNKKIYQVASLKCGFNTVLTKMQNDFEKKYNETFSHEQLFDVLRDGKVFVGGWQDVDVHAYVDGYIKTFIRDLESHGIHYKMYPKIYMIGGAIEFKQLFEALTIKFAEYDIEPLPLPQFANVYALHSTIRHLGKNLNG